MKTLLIVLFYCTYFYNGLGQVTNISTGQWSNPTIWSNNQTPTSADSIFLNFDLVIDINANCKAFNANGHSVIINSDVIFNIIGNSDVVIDIDNNVYHTIKIGNQTWMKENLKVAHYQNGDTLVSIKYIGTEEKGGIASYNDDPLNDSKFGKLYNWYAVTNSKKLAPVGWHIPSDSEWKILENYLNGDGGAMKDTLLWAAPNTGATNTSKFSGLPAGETNYDGTTHLAGQKGTWYSSSADNATGISRSLHYSANWIFTSYADKHYGFSVRCIKD